MNLVRTKNLYPWLGLFVIASFSGCVSTGSKNMQTVVTDMHQRVTLLDAELEPSLSKLNENAAALIQRVNENERQVRVLTSLVEENQHKLDRLLKMLADLRTTLYRHWGLNASTIGAPTSTAGSGIQIVPPAGSTAPRVEDVTVSPPVETPAASKGGEGDTAAYVAAKDLYDQENYPAAEAAFARFLTAFPGSGQADKAQFWLAKSYLNQGQYSRAISGFEALRRDYGESTYMAFALHNQAVGHFQLGEKNKAVALMEEVVANYPTSTAADHARRDLKELGE